LPKTQLGEKNELRDNGFRSLMDTVPEPDWNHPKIQSLISQNARAKIQIAIAKDIIESGSEYDPGAIDGEYSEDWHEKLRAIVLEAEAYRKTITAPQPEVTLRTSHSLREQVSNQLSAGNPSVRFSKEGKRIPLEGGWKEHTLYLVEASTGPNDPIHEAYFMVGFLNATPKWGVFGSYTCLINCQDGSPYTDWYYLKALKALHTQQPQGVTNDSP
jgi:hypothetical protein